MGDKKNKSNSIKGISDKKSSEVLDLEKEVALGLWIQVIGQLIEIKGLSGLLQTENQDSVGEQQILTGVWIKAIGQILEAISVTNQISETDFNKLLQEQKMAITGDMLSSLGSAYDAMGGLQVLREEAIKNTRVIP